MREAFLFAAKRSGFAVGRALVALLYVLLSSPPLAAATAVDAYIERSGLAEELELIGGKVLRKIEEAQAQPDDAMPRLKADQMKRLRVALEGPFAGGQLRLAIRSHLDALLVRGDVEVFLQWLDSPLGKRITAIEVSGAALDAPRRATENPAQALAGLSTARKVELERILKASGVDARTATLELNVARIMILAAGMPVRDIGPAYSGQNRLENPSQDRLEPSRRQIAIELAPKSLAYIAAIYVPLSDDELRDYAKVLERSSSRRVTEALNDAFDRALSAAATETGLAAAQRQVR